MQLSCIRVLFRDGHRYLGIIQGLAIQLDRGIFRCLTLKQEPRRLLHYISQYSSTQPKADVPSNPEPVLCPLLRVAGLHIL